MEVVAMLQTMWANLRRDEEGLSVLEVVLAAFILFFVLTAVLGLVGTSTRMNLNAEARTAMSNAVSSHIEWVRSLDFEQIALSGSSAEAALASDYTYVVEGFTINIENTIQTGQDGTKEVQVTATASSPGYPTVEMTAFTAIRNKDNDVDDGSYPGEENSEAPEITILSSTADADAVIYSSYVMGGEPLYVAATADARADGAVISEFGFYCATSSGAEALRDGATIFADVAYWSPNTASVSKTFRWDTRQVDEHGDRVIGDGWANVSLVAIDSDGRPTSIDRRYYVDNEPPEAPGGDPIGEVQTSLETRVSWPTAKDGPDADDFAWKYELVLQKVGMDGSLDLEEQVILTDPAYIQATTPFSRYVPAVRAGSPRNLWSSWMDGEVYTSLAEVVGYSDTTFAGRNKSRTSYTDVVLAVSPPTFGTTSIRYDLYRSTNPDTISSGTPYMTDVGPAFSETIVKTVGKFGVPDTWYYQFKVTYTPSGYMGGSSEVMWSDVVGPISPGGYADMEIYQ